MVVKTLAACAIVVGSALLPASAVYAGETGQWLAISAQCKVLAPWAGFIDPVVDRASGAACRDGFVSGARTLKLRVLAGKAGHRGALDIFFKATFVSGKATAAGAYALQGEGEKSAMLTYVGGFGDGEPQGSGKLVWNSYFVEEGQFSHGVLNGYGSDYYLGGEKARADGNFKDGHLDGPGMRTTTTGAKITGTFHAGYLVGYGTWTEPDGTTSRVIQTSKDEYQRLQ